MLPLSKLFGQYLLFTTILSFLIALFRMGFLHLILKYKKINHSKKFNKKIIKNTLIAYFNSFFIIGIYINLNMYISQIIPTINIFIWGLIFVSFILQTIQSIYLSYIPYYKVKDKLKKYVITAFIANSFIILLLYVFLFNPILKTLF